MPCPFETLARACFSAQEGTDYRLSARAASFCGFRARIGAISLVYFFGRPAQKVADHIFCYGTMSRGEACVYGIGFLSVVAEQGMSIKTVVGCLNMPVPYCAVIRLQFYTAYFDSAVFLFPKHYFTDTNHDLAQLSYFPAKYRGESNESISDVKGSVRVLF